MDNKSRNKCKINNEVFAKKQGTIYDQRTNTMLYGINRNMRAFGVSDGTCNQINPLMFTDNYKCGLGAAGGNKCIPNTYSNNQENLKNNQENFKNIIENFNEENNNTLWYFFIIVLIIIIVFYNKNNNNNKSTNFI